MKTFSNVMVVSPSERFASAFGTAECLFRLCFQAILARLYLFERMDYSKRTETIQGYSFYCTDALFCCLYETRQSPRVSVTFSDSLGKYPASATVECHFIPEGIVSTIKVVFPDRILGFENMNLNSNSTYRGLFYNLDASNTESNLFDLLYPLSVAFVKAIAQAGIVPKVLK